MTKEDYIRIAAKKMHLDIDKVSKYREHTNHVHIEFDYGDDEIVWVSVGKRGNLISSGVIED